MKTRMTTFVKAKLMESDGHWGIDKYRVSSVNKIEKENNYYGQTYVLGLEFRDVCLLHFKSHGDRAIISCKKNMFKMEVGTFFDIRVATLSTLYFI